MQARDFCFFLQGLLEVGKIKSLDEEQVTLIKAHLDLVFRHDAGIKTKEMVHEGASPISIQSLLIPRKIVNDGRTEMIC